METQMQMWKCCISTLNWFLGLSATIGYKWSSFSTNKSVCPQTDSWNMSTSDPKACWRSTVCSNARWLNSVDFHVYVCDLCWISLFMVLLLEFLVVFFLSQFVFQNPFAVSIRLDTFWEKQKGHICSQKYHISDTNKFWFEQFVILYFVAKSHETLKIPQQFILHHYLHYLPLSLTGQESWPPTSSWGLLWRSCPLTKLIYIKRAGSRPVKCHVAIYKWINWSEWTYAN